MGMAAFMQLGPASTIVRLFEVGLRNEIATCRVMAQQFRRGRQAEGIRVQLQEAE